LSLLGIEFLLEIAGGGPVVPCLICISAMRFGLEANDDVVQIAGSSGGTRRDLAQEHRVIVPPQPVAMRYAPVMSHIRARDIMDRGCALSL
jgi:hypothetical protein